MYAWREFLIIALSYGTLFCSIYTVATSNYYLYIIYRYMYTNIFYHIYSDTVYIIIILFTKLEVCSAGKTYLSLI